MNDAVVTLVALILELTDKLRAANAEIERLREAAKPKEGE